MSDWEFLYEMRERGYSAEEIADAAGSGAAPWEWAEIDREWIDSELDEETQDSAKHARYFPASTLTQAEIFHDLVNCAVRHFENTGRYLQIWGELGEIYAEVKFGLCRHPTHTAGSDGTILGKLVEVKTISPEKSSSRVLVKKAGNFEQLLIVRINENFKFTSKLFERDELNGGVGKFFNGQLKT